MALTLGLNGFAGRASGVASDLRCDFAMAPYAGLGVKKAGHRNGDVAARAAVRFDELLESLRLIPKIVSELPGGDVFAQPVFDGARKLGAGWVEAGAARVCGAGFGWRENSPLPLSRSIVAKLAGRLNMR